MLLPLLIKEVVLTLSKVYSPVLNAYRRICHSGARVVKWFIAYFQYFCGFLTCIQMLKYF